MKTTIRMTQSLTALAVLLLSGVALAAEPPAAPAILDYYSCNYNDGKDRDDVMAARDYYLKQAEKAGLSAETAYLWEIAKGQGAPGFVWMNVHANMSAFAADMEENAASSDMAGVLPRFYTAATCENNIGAISPVFQREGANADGGDGGALVSSYACNLRDGATAANVGDLNRHIADVFGGWGATAPNSTFLVNPITAGPTTPDLYLFNVHESATEWTKFFGALFTTPEGQLLGRHVQAVLDCNMSLWNAQRVVEGPGNG